MAAVRGGGGRWAFSLGTVVDADGAFVAPDLCESLGSLHPVYTHPTAAHIDANCYLFSRELAVRVAHQWYIPTGPTGMPKPDQAMCQTLLTRVRPACPTRRHTVNYAVGSRPTSVTADYFLHGNAAMRQRYPHGLPWERGV